MVEKPGTKILAKLPLMHDPGEQFTYGTSIDPSRDMVAILFTHARETPKWNELFDGYERIVNHAVVPGSMDYAGAE